MSSTYITTEELASRIHYDPRTIRNKLVGLSRSLWTLT